MLISELMAPELASEMAVTRKLLERIPDDKLGWKPSDGLHTIGWNASHLVEVAGWVPAIVAEREIDMAPVGGPAYVTPEATMTSLLLGAFDDNVAKSLAALNGVPDSVMAEPWSLKMGGHVLFTMNKGDCLRKWVFSHTAHHRGILSSYLRMAGLQFSSIFEEYALARATAGRTCRGTHTDAEPGAAPDRGGGVWSIDYYLSRNRIADAQRGVAA